MNILPGDPNLPPGVTDQMIKGPNMKTQVSKSANNIHRLEDGTVLADEIRQVVGQPRTIVRRFNVLGTRTWAYITLEQVEESKNTHRLYVNIEGDWYGAMASRIRPRGIADILSTRAWVDQQERHSYHYATSAFPEARSGTWDEGVILLKASSVEYIRPDGNYALVYSDAGIVEIFTRQPDHNHDVPGATPFVFYGEFHNAKVRGGGDTFEECVRNYWQIGRAQQEYAMGRQAVGAL